MKHSRLLFLLPCLRLPPPRPLLLAARSRYNPTATTAAAAAAAAVRYQSSVPASSDPAPEQPTQQPSYDLEFTCRPCQTRSKHRISRNAYHRGSILIQCPGCQNRHVITDHLKIFGEKARTLEEILAMRGEVLTTVRVQPKVEGQAGAETTDVEVLPKEEGEAKDTQ